MHFLLIVALLGVASLFVPVIAQVQSTTTCTNTTVNGSTCFTDPSTSVSTPFVVYGFRPGFEVVHQYWQAAGERFYLGGSPATYCPDSVEETNDCPPGNATVFTGSGFLVRITSPPDFGWTDPGSRTLKCQEARTSILPQQAT